jgi:hypothetical protein
MKEAVEKANQIRETEAKPFREEVASFGVGGQDLRSALRARRRTFFAERLRAGRCQGLEMYLIVIVLLVDFDREQPCRRCVSVPTILLPGKSWRARK